MRVNTWDVLQLVFMIWVFMGLFVAMFAAMWISEFEATKHKVIVAVAAFLVWTLLVVIGGFLYYKNMETKCLYDPDFSGPCLEDKMS